LSIALRYLRARSHDSFISFISLVSMLGVGLAVAVLIVVLSVMNGFESELRQRVLSVVSHATVTGYGGPVEDWEALRRHALARDDVAAVAPFVEGQGMIVGGQSSAGVRVRGIDPMLEPEVSRIGELLESGGLDELAAGAYGMLIGASLARELGVTEGDRLVLVIAQGTVTPAGLIPRMRTFTVSGIFTAGMYEYDRGLVFVNMQDAAALFRTGGKASGVRLVVTDIYAAGQTARELALELGGGFYVSDWTRQHVNFFRSIQLTKTIMFVLLSMVIAVAAFNIVSTLVMVVRDKRGDIAILRSFGASPRHVLAIFGSQGTLIGLVGAALGVALGALVASQLETLVSLLERGFGIDLLSEEVYFISDLPTQVRVAEVMQIGLIALGLAVVATLYPALSASREAPAEALRHE
jgi:lipoprotein-releasing system permease protein